MRELRTEQKCPATKWVNIWNRYEIGRIDQRKLVSILCELVFDAIIILNYCFSFLCWRMQNRSNEIFGRCVEFEREKNALIFPYFSTKGSVSIGCAAWSGQCLLSVANWRLRHSHSDDWLRWHSCHSQSTRPIARPNRTASVSVPTHTCHAISHSDGRRKGE